MSTVVLLDALGTLVELQPPAPRLRRLLGAAGFEADEDRTAAGFAAEIAYYLEHHLDGSDSEALDDLRDRCAEALRRALGLPGLDHATARRVMLEALEFAPFPDAPPALRELRGAGHALIVVSNWDCSLPEWLRPAGVLDLVDAVVSSAAVGAAKPDPAPFRRALELAGVGPGHALHVGDSLENDVEGARAAGVRPVLLARDGSHPSGVESVRSLAEIASLV
ncbi:MAG TPA: HAD-IA family hydrolase [Thermoleophilaceae bacterium]|nr:HAD-IA family hydrolase [Thermoleophilaceae bacterium]